MLILSYKIGDFKDNYKDASLTPITWSNQDQTRLIQACIKRVDKIKKWTPLVIYIFLVPKWSSDTKSLSRCSILMGQATRFQNNTLHTCYFINLLKSRLFSLNIVKIIVSLIDILIFKSFNKKLMAY